MTAQMTGRERLLAAIRHEEPDRVPISPRIGAFLSVYYGSSSWMHHLRAAQEFGFDICLPAASPMPAFIHSPALVYRHLPQEVKVTQAIEEQDGGVTIRRTFETPDGPLSDETFVAPPGREYGVSPSPVKREHLLKAPDDLDRLRYVMPDPARLNLHDYDEISRIVGDAGLVEVTLNPPLDHFLGDARGLSQLMMDYYLDRPFFDRMVALFQAYSLAVLKAVLEHGVRYIFGTWYYASLSAGWSPAILRECFMPIVRQHAERVHRYDGIYHLYDDGRMMSTLGDYVAAGGRCGPGASQAAVRGANLPQGVRGPVVRTQDGHTRTRRADGARGDRGRSAGRGLYPRHQRLDPRRHAYGKHPGLL